MAEKANYKKKTSVQTLSLESAVKFYYPKITQRFIIPIPSSEVLCNIALITYHKKERQTEEDKGV